MTFRCKHCFRPLPRRSKVRLCETCATAPIWLAKAIKGKWTVSRLPFPDETSAAEFAADLGGRGSSLDPRSELRHQKADACSRVWISINKEEVE